MDRHTPRRLPTLNEIEALERFARAVRRRGKVALAREAEYQAALARRLRETLAAPPLQQDRDFGR